MVHISSHPDFIQRSPYEGGGGPHYENDPVVYRGTSTVKESVADIFAAQPDDGFDINSTTEKKEGEFDMDWAAAHFPRNSFVRRRCLIAYLNHWGWTKDLVEQASSLRFSADMNEYSVILECQRAHLSASLVMRIIERRFTYEQFRMAIELIEDERLHLPDLYEASGFEARTQWQVNLFNSIFDEDQLEVI